MRNKYLNLIIDDDEGSQKQLKSKIPEIFVVDDDLITMTRNVLYFIGSNMLLILLIMLVTVMSGGFDLLWDLFDLC